MLPHPTPRQKAWGEELAKCGVDAREDYPNEGARCMAQFYDTKKNLTTCDQKYCECTQGTWLNATTTSAATCNTTGSMCDTTCKCMETCYFQMLDCTFKEILSAVDTADCRKSEIYECVDDSYDSLVDECKRGVKQGRLSWMETPLPDLDCDEKLICASSAFSPMGLLSVALTLAAVMCS